MKYLDKKVELITSSDGSHTLFLPDMDETYHSTHGAIQEAQHVFIKYGIEHLLQNDLSFKKISILEVGMGTGLNVYLTLLFASEYPEISFNIHTIEAYPLEWELVSQLNYCDQLETSKELFESIHKQEWGVSVQLLSNVELTKEVVLLEDFQSDKEFDIVFFDAFAPSRQAEMWTVVQLSKAIQPIKVGGELITYCANGQFKRNLKALELEVVPLPGPPGKREITRGIKK